jgi:Pyruvate/2-oxoglutarate dehydrogenase complex, dehydrogenase (E1) component, eukaryotic type, beta subunit
MEACNMIQALNQALELAMEKNEKTVVFGEDVGHFGGVFRVTSGLQKRFGQARCFDTPLCEQGIIGFAVGLAQYGYKVVAEIQFADYIFPAYDQIVNEVAKMRYRTGNQYSCPMVIRTPYGGGIHGGHYHSQSPEAQFLHTPGLKVVVPSSPYDAKGLLLEAIASDDPILFLEPKRIYRALKESVPDEYYRLPIGPIEVARPGDQVTLIGWGAQHQENLKAADELANRHGVSVEVVLLRSLNPLDIEGIVRSVQKTGRVVIAHEAPVTQGFGAEIATQIQEQAFLYLEAPIKRCCGFDTPFPHTLEHEYLPDATRVVQAVLDTIHY